MTRRYREPLTEVALTDEGQPAAFRWRGAAYRVLAVLGHWREDARWWVGGAMEVPQRDLWRVEVRNGRRASTGVFELVREDDGWRLERIWD